VTITTTGHGADDDVKERLVALSAQIMDALVEGNLKFLDDVLDDDWMIISSGGLMGDKPLLMKEMKDGTIKFEAMENREMKVRVFGDAAVVNGVNRGKIKYQGEDVGGTTRFTEVYVRRAGKWRCVSVQLTPIAARAGAKP
jgi:hypothetical protein